MNWEERVEAFETRRDGPGEEGRGIITREGRNNELGSTHAGVGP